MSTSTTSTSSTTSPSRKERSRAHTTASCHSPAGEIPPTGRPVSIDYIQVLRFRDGKHASFNLMFDRLLMLEQLGVVPAPAPAS
jgi:ketosteroid isomerase-like protein